MVDNPDSGLAVEVRVWNGSEFVPDQLLVDELIVLDENGVIRLADGIVSAPQLAADALHAKVINNGQFFGGYIEAPTIASIRVPDGELPVQVEFIAAAEQAEGRSIRVEGVERMDFYARARRAFRKSVARGTQPSAASISGKAPIGRITSATLRVDLQAKWLKATTLAAFSAFCAAAPSPKSRPGSMP